ncbi:hypothetical protein LEMLEM_LOCUS3189, partial [Lemmus lemmus]
GWRFVGVLSLSGCRLGCNCSLLGRSPLICDCGTRRLGGRFSWPGSACGSWNNGG